MGTKEPDELHVRPAPKNSLLLAIKVGSDRLFATEISGNLFIHCSWRCWAFRPAHRVRSVVRTVQAQLDNPMPEDPGVRVSTEMRGVVESAGEEEVFRLQAGLLDPRLQCIPVVGVISNWTGRWVLCCKTMARVATWSP